MQNFKEKYKEKQLINRSQLADTYKAVNSITKDIVTLKVIINNSDNDEYMDNLKKEIEMLRSIENPNLTCINTMANIIGEGRNYYYIEAENFSNTSLKKKLQSGKFSGLEAIKILKQVAEGLKEFHFKSIVYGKLNCDNIYINENGDVKLDTLAYLEGKDFFEPSQEEFTGQEEFNDEEDIYSLGVVLFELITGDSNFQQEEYKDQISDKDILYIIDRCINKDIGIYEDLNEFILYANTYLECSEESDSDNVVSQEEMPVKENEEVSKTRVKKNSHKIKPSKIIKGLGICLLVFLMMIAIINGKNLFNNKKNEETKNTKPPVEIQPEEKTQEEKTPEKEEIQIVEPVSNQDTYNQPVDNDTDDSYNNISNDYNLNDNNSNNDKNNYTNNNKNNNNSGGGKYPSHNNTRPNPTRPPGNGTTKPEDDQAEETPIIDPTPDPTPGSDDDDSGVDIDN